MKPKPFGFNIFDLGSIKKPADKRIKFVKDMVDKDGNNIYKNISGCENEENYVLYDISERVTGLKRHVISVTSIFSGKVNEEYKMTTGHAHPQEEIYMFMKGRGKLVLDSDEWDMEEGDSMTIPSNVWHRVVNTGLKPLEVLCMFEKYSGRG